MGIKKYIKGAIEYLGLDDFKASGKKKSIKRLLEKLNARKEKIEKALDKKATKKANKKELKEDLDILSVQIKKGNKILERLND